MAIGGKSSWASELLDGPFERMEALPVIFFVGHVIVR